MPEEFKLRKQQQGLSRFPDDQREQPRAATPEEKQESNRKKRREIYWRRMQRERFEEQEDVKETAELRKQNHAIGYGLWCFWGASYGKNFDCPMTLMQVVEDAIASINNSRDLHQLAAPEAVVTETIPLEDWIPSLDAEIDI